jgi:hypothetical protein
MRFITEFELLTPFEIKNYKSLREKGTAEWLGLDIARAFGWQQKGETTLHGPVSERHSLEIEAFPMDKWIEFRKRLLASLPDYDNTSRIRIENALHDLESTNIKQLKEG